MGRDSVPVRAVVDVHTASIGFDESGPAQLAEVMADGRFGQPENGRELTAIFPSQPTS